MTERFVVAVGVYVPSATQISSTSGHALAAVSALSSRVYAFAHDVPSFAPVADPST